MRLGSSESATFGGCCVFDTPLSLGAGRVPFGFFKSVFTSFGFAFSGGALGGVEAVGLLSATRSDEFADLLPLCFFFGGGFPRSARSRVAMSFSRLTGIDSRLSDASSLCGFLRFLDFFEDDEEAGCVETDQPGTWKSGGRMSTVIGVFILVTPTKPLLQERKMTRSICHRASPVPCPRPPDKR